MPISLVPLLQIQRELYALPAGPERFRAYVRTMTGDRDDMLLPLSLMNPMGKPHVAARLDALLAFDAEDVARSAIADVRSRLETAGVALDDGHADLTVALVVADDAHGGWTHRQFTDAAHRFDDRHGIARGWATVVLWSSDEPSPAIVTREVIAAIYRVLYIRRYGFPASLDEKLRQEGYVAAFAGAPRTIEESDLARTRGVLAKHRATTSAPVSFACIFGDDAARDAGYDPLGLAAGAGFAVGLDDALASGIAPESLLRREVSSR